MGKKRKILLLVIGFIILWNLFFGTLMYLSYMQTVENTFGNIKSDIKNSKLLTDKFGQIKEVKFNNFMQWVSEKNNENCIKVKVTTNDGKYKICTIIDWNENEYWVKGYFIDDKKYEEVIN